MKKTEEDMHSLLYRVRDEDVLHYVEEAYVCFEAGAYRACIVMTANAVFKDLRKTRKVKKIISGGDAIVKDIEAIVFQQKAFEQTLVERLAAEKIISGVQNQRLLQLIDHRNKAAHPSGIDASPEEARFVFVEAITKFLQHRGLSGYDAVQNLFLRLPGTNFFPDETPRMVEDIVHSELVHLDPKAVNAICARLSKELFSKNAQMARNAKLLLRGLCQQGNTDILEAVAKHLVEPKAAEPTFVAKLYDIFAIDARILCEFDPADRKRLDAGVACIFRDLPLDTERGSTYHPLDLLESLLTRHLPEELIFGEFGKTIDVLADRFGRDVSVFRMPIPSDIRDKFLEAFVGTLEGKNGSAAAQVAARSVLDNINDVEHMLNENEVLRIVISLAASTALGDKLSLQVRDGGYAVLRYLLPKAVWGLQLQYDEAPKLLERVKDAELRLLLSSEAAE